MAKAPSVEELREDLDVLTEFERDYRRYVESQVAIDQGRTPEIAESSLPQMRRELMLRLTRAGEAFNATGLQMTITPPPMFGGPVLTDFTSQVFAHETHTFGSGGPDAAYMVLDALVTGIGTLRGKVAEAERAEAERKPAATRAKETAAGHLPTLWGRIRHVPRVVATLADFITVGALIVGGLKVLGVF
jgi:hypothetical protein